MFNHFFLVQSPGVCPCGVCLNLPAFFSAGPGSYHQPLQGREQWAPVCISMWRFEYILFIQPAQPIYIYMYIYICVCVHIYIYMYTSICISCVKDHVYIYICIWYLYYIWLLLIIIYLCIYNYIHMFVTFFTHHVYIIYIYIHTYSICSVVYCINIHVCISHIYIYIKYLYTFFRGSRPSVFCFQTTWESPTVFCNTCDFVGPSRLLGQRHDITRYVG
jgi:hypothetical protein